MRIDVAALKSQYEAIRGSRPSGHAVERRSRPRRAQYDYLVLRTLAEDLSLLFSELPGTGGLAIDVGAGRSPYADQLQLRGFTVKTLDLDAEQGADYVGTAEATGLPSATFDLVVSTQVLEHCADPFAAVREASRILRPGGQLIFSVPHVWFYHPHPADNWRFTQEGVITICRQAGLSPVSVLSQGGTLLALAQAFDFIAFGALGGLGAPLYLLVNTLAPALDRLIQNQLFCLNFAVRAEKAPVEAPAVQNVPQTQVRGQGHAS